MSTLAENVAKVAAAHAALKTAIAAKGVTVPDGTKLSGMPALVEQIETPPEPNVDRISLYNNTSIETVDFTKPIVCDLAAMKNLAYCFYGCESLRSLALPEGFGSEATNLSYCFYNCRLLGTLDFPEGFGSKATNMDHCFYNMSYSLPVGSVQVVLPDGCGSAAGNVESCFSQCGAISISLPDGFGSKSRSVASCFNNCRSLHTLILGTGFASAASRASSCFKDCQSLANIFGQPNFKTSVDFSACTKLSTDSLRNIIRGLQTVTTAKTLTLGATNLAKLTNGDKKAATDKGWTLA